MKILYHHRIASKDGQYVHVEEIINALRELGHEVVIVSPSIMKNSEFGSDGGIIAKLKQKIPGAVYEILEFSYSIVAFVKLWWNVSKHRPDFIYERYNLYMPAGIWIKKIYRIPLLLEVNAPIFNERMKYNGISIPKLAKWSEIYTWSNAENLLPVTHVLAKYILKQGIPPERITIIPNGINGRQFSDIPDKSIAKKRLGLEKKVVLGFTGFIRDWHGLEKVVELLASAYDGKPRHLLIVGDGPGRMSIQQRAEELGVQDAVTITGIIPRNRILEYIAAFDVALQPDVVDYASPLKLFEYMALAKAVVAPDSENIKEVLKHEDNALLFDTSNDHELVEVTRRLCDDEKLRQQLGNNAREYIFRNGYTWNDNAKKIISVYKQTIENLTIPGTL